MKKHGEHCPQRKIENIAMFGAGFTTGHIVDTVVGQLNNPQTVDRPHGEALVLALAISGLATAVVDRLVHRNQSQE